MTNEEKQLLLKDLCARLPYGVKVQICNLKEYAPTVKGVLNDDLFLQFDYNQSIKNGDSTYNIINDNVKPYLRPMSSMTEEEKMGYDDLCYNCQEQDRVDYNITELDRTQLIYVIDWLNAHHFDYRGLIDEGLALEAPEGMYELPIN